MDTLVIIDLKPAWSSLRACYDRSSANTLMITFDAFVNIAIEAYMVEMDKPGESDAVLEALVDFGEMQPMVDQSDIVKREVCHACNLIDIHLTGVLVLYFGVEYLGGIKQMRLTPYRTLEVRYGKEVT